MALFRKPDETTPALEPELRALEDALGRYRPQPSGALLVAIAGPPAPAAPARHPRLQLAFAGGLTATLLVALAAVGGVSYAATAVTHAGNAVRQVLVSHVSVVGKGITAGGDQYRPGYGFGDPNHTHTGPPGLSNGKHGEKAPPSQVTPTRDGKAAIATGQITCDEQAALYFSVLDAQGTQLLLTQKGSTIGSGVDGPQAKTIHYVMLVPRAIPVQIRVPKNLLQRGQTYRIRVIAVSPSGEKSTTYISFTA